MWVRIPDNEIRTKLNFALKYPFTLCIINLKIPVGVVAARFAENKNLFLKSESKVLKSKLDVIQKYNVEPLSILNYQLAFKSSVERIEELARALQGCGLEKISSWMIHKVGTAQLTK